MPTFQSDASTTTFTGSVNCAGASLTIPSGATVQEFAETDGSLVWIQPSGQFAIYFAASGWMMADTAPGGAPAAPSMDPDDASVSGFLKSWFNNDGLAPSTPGESGMDEWIASDFNGETCVDYGPGWIASGIQNGLDAAHFEDNADPTRYVGTNSPPVIPFQGTNLPHTCIAVLKPLIKEGEWGLYFSMGDINQAYADIYFWGIDNVGDWGHATHNGGSTGQYFRLGAADYSKFSIVSWVDSGTEVECYVDGVLKNAGTSGSANGEKIPIRRGIGCPLNNAHNGNTWNGLIGEICLYSSGMADSDREKVEQGLIEKWDLTV